MTYLSFRVVVFVRMFRHKFPKHVSAFFVWCDSIWRLALLIPVYPATQAQREREKGDTLQFKYK